MNDKVISENDTLRPLGPNTRNLWHSNEKQANLIRPERASKALHLSAEPKNITVDTQRSALIIIDMQNDFCHHDGWLASIGVDVTPAREAIAPIAALLPMVRHIDIPVIWVNWGNRPDLANISPALTHVYDGDAMGHGLGARQGKRQSPVLEKDAWSAQVVDELEISDKDICIDKHRMSGFWDTPLDAILRNLRCDTLFFCGVNADQCVLHTLADANFLGYDTILLEEATTTTSPSFCMEATLYNARQIFGFTVKASDLGEAIKAQY